MTAILQCNTLSKAFGSVVVADSIDFSIEKGEAVGIIGPNGAGKTSLFNLITGTLQPSSGQIIFNGKNITALNCASRCRRGIARSFQIPQPFAAMSVYENVLVAATHGARLKPEQAQTTSIDALHKTGLFSRVNDLAGSLTLLERKRLELTRALASNPSLLLLDEIAGGLTDNECQALIQTIQDIRSTGVTIVWIEHVVHALLAVVERLIVLDFGKVIADGNPHSVINSTAVQENYMGLAADA
jgi:branched-chain amino acid transport system ATP-binding protein